MKLAGLLSFLSLAGSQASANPQAVWIADGARKCTFDADIKPTRCEQYHRAIAHKLKDGRVWSEYRWMWKDSRFEVQYSSRVGSFGVSEFTIGEVTYRNSGSPKYTRAQAVTYAVSREELVIGVPGDGYRFAMEGAI